MLSSYLANVFILSVMLIYLDHFQTKIIPRKPSVKLIAPTFTQRLNTEYIVEESRETVLEVKVTR